MEIDQCRRGHGRNLISTQSIRGSGAPEDAVRSVEDFQILRVFGFADRAVLDRSREVADRAVRERELERFLLNLVLWDVERPLHVAGAVRVVRLDLCLEDVGWLHREGGDRGDSDI